MMGYCDYCGKPHVPLQPVVFMHSDEPQYNRETALRNYVCAQTVEDIVKQEQSRCYRRLVELRKLKAFGVVNLVTGGGLGEL